MHKSWANQAAHEDVFVERYAWLREWARTFAKGDLSLADDLLHTAYVQFTTRRPPLVTVRDVEAYLYTLLRNLHVSHTRWVKRKDASLSVVDYDSLALAVQHGGTGLEVWDQLRAVCAYSCRRKETSKAGSVLLLRFFHGYFPSEIGRILRCPPKTVNEWLRLARGEARICLQDPNALGFLGEARPVAGSDGTRSSGVDTLAALRRSIFAARTGDCLEPADLRRLYMGPGRDSVPCATLAHIVSCASCLDRVTHLLGLQSYDDRDPTDMLGNNSTSVGGRSAPARPLGPTPLERRAWETGRRTVFEHRPQELQVGVNGFRLSAVPVRSAVTDLRLTVPLNEPLGFVEIRSEQSVCLLLMDVTPAPHGEMEQTAHATLSDGRRLDVTLSLADPWPALHVVYRDPEWTAHSAPELAVASAEAVAPAVEAQPREQHPWVVPRVWDLRWDGAGRWRGIRSALGRGAGRLAALSGLTSIGRLALAHRQVAVTAMLVLVALGWWAPGPWRQTSLSAAELLDRTRAREQQALSAPDIVVHRVLHLEERRPPEARPVAKHRIEVWRNTRQRLAVKRAYDEAGRLVAGEWTRADGTRTVYRAGAAPALGEARVSPDDVWRFEPSAADFERLVGATPHAGVEERGNAYVISYRGDDEGDALLEATLTIDKSSEHAVAQTLLLRRDGALREYRVSESGINRLPERVIKPETFEPEPILLGSTPLPLAELTTAPRRPARAAIRASAAAVMMRPRLEMAVWHLLHRHHVCLNGQSQVERTGDGQLAVTVRPASEEQASLVADSLARVAATFPDVALGIDVQASPAAETPGTQRGAAVQELGAWIRDRVARRAEHQQALDELVTQWASHPLAALDPDAADQWNSMVQDHARGLAQETAALRARLEQVWKGHEAPAAPEREAVDALPFSHVPALLERARELSVKQDASLARAFGCAVEPCQPLDDEAAVLSSLHTLDRLIARLSAPWIQGQ